MSEGLGSSAPWLWWWVQTYRGTSAVHVAVKAPGQKEDILYQRPQLYLVNTQGVIAPL